MTGMLWQLDIRNTENDIQKAMDIYKTKYGKAPTFIAIHPQKILTTKKLKVITQSTGSLNTVLIGAE